MRWRLSGTGWVLAPSLVTLARQVDEVWPERHAADGTLGNVTHSSRTSDHNPDSNHIVHAIDIGEVVENDAMIVAEAIRLSKDKRVKYVIHEARMYSSYWKSSIPPFTWRSYSGVNLHWSHVHISSLSEHDNLTTSWDIGKEVEMPLNQFDSTIVDIAFALGAEGDRDYWKGLDRDSAEFADLANAVRSEAGDLLSRIDALEKDTSMNVDSAARTQAKAAHTRLDKLHSV